MVGMSEELLRGCVQGRAATTTEGSPAFKYDHRMPWPSLLVSLVPLWWLVQGVRQLRGTSPRAKLRDDAPQAIRRALVLFEPAFGIFMALFGLTAIWIGPLMFPGWR